MRIILLFLSVSLLFNTIHSQSRPSAKYDETKKLAEVGKTSITAGEFMQRYELSPQVGMQSKESPEVQKQNFLYTLIAEKLWALKAQDMAMDTSEIMRYTFKTIEKMYVRDAVYKIEVTDKINIPEKEYVKAYFRAAINLRIDYLVSAAEKEIRGLHHLLKIGVPFDTLLLARKGMQPDTTMEVSYGMLQEEVEDSVYKLHPGEFTSPIQGPDAWYIFRVKERLDAITNSKDQENSQSKARKTLKDRYADTYYAEFYKKFFSGKKINARGDVFWSFADQVINILKNRNESKNLPNGEKVYLDYNDTFVIEKSIGRDTLNMEYILIDDQPVTLKQFLRDFMFEGFYSTTVNPDTLRGKLNSRVRTYIEQELVAREGYKRGLQNLPDVQNAIKMWKENYLASLLKNKFADSTSVSDQEITDLYSQRYKEKILPQQVNIIEILTDSLEVVENVFNQISAGADFKELARRYTKRSWAKENGGEFGYFPVTMHGEIGKIAGGMSVGEVYGPLKVPEGYSIFKLIDKKDQQVEAPQTLDEVKNELKMSLTYQKMSDKLMDYTARLANQYGVSINEEALASLKTTNLAMFVYRYFGFGGRLPAVPLTSPFSEWMKVWQENKEDLP